MLPSGRRIGVHLPLGVGMVKAADRAVEIGATTIQVFTDNPTSWRRRPTLPEELPAFRARLADADIAPIAIHAPYPELCQVDLLPASVCGSQHQHHG